MRLTLEKRNEIRLNTASLSSFVRSDVLNTGLFKEKMLLHSIILKINITASSGDPTVASLGTVKIINSREGEIMIIPLQLLTLFLQAAQYPYHVDIGTNSLNVIIPIPFAVIEGVRPKDTYEILTAEDNWYIEVNGNAETGITYSSYVITPYLLGERTLNPCLPSKGRLRISTDTIPGNCIDYESKLDIQGASLMVFTFTDYSDIDFSKIQMKIKVDGLTLFSLDDLRVSNFVNCYIRDKDASYSYFPNAIVVNPLIDRKLAKLSRSSKFTVLFSSQYATAKDIQVIYRKIETPDYLESQEIARRQGVNVETSIPLPVTLTGNITSKPIKPLFRKIKPIEFLEGEGK